MSSIRDRRDIDSLLASVAALTGRVAVLENTVLELASRMPPLNAVGKELPDAGMMTAPVSNRETLRARSQPVK